MSDDFSVVDKFFGESKDTKKFRLSDQFISTYAGKDPTFGFNGLGEVTYYRTFSRILENGKKEKFIDTATRVVEGTYEIQRRYCQRNNLPFDHKKAQDSAQEMFERMWAFKWLPPGRGLWIMGTPFMWRSGGAALNNCFAGDTEYITRDGIKKLKDTVGTTQRVLSTGGKWVNAKIKSFGEQELLKLTVSRGRHSKVIHVTADHRWLVKSKCKSLAIASGFSKSENNDSYRIREVDTSGLKKGMRLAVNFGSGISNNIRPSVVGIMHGICVGDGTTGSDDSNHGTYLYLCGHKDKQLLKYFSEFHITDDLEKCEGGSKRVADLPRFFRQMPNLSEATTYLYGWLAGYFAADGRVSDSGSVQISSKTLSNLETVKSVCAILGIGTHEITSGYQTVTNKGVTKKFLQYRITLFADHLRDEFFLIDEHRAKFQTIRKSGRKKIPQYCHWVVDSVESTGIRQEVYCPQVPDYHTFTLSGNILTGNCGFVSTEDDFAADPSQPFAFAMDMLMLGVGIGFDTKGANKVKIKKPTSKTSKYIVYDSREGWVEAFSDLVRSYTINTDLGHLVFDCSEIRPKGSPIKGFGGEASGPEGLIELLSSVDEFLAQRVKQKLSSVDITDLMNMVGKCVVAGNVRRCIPKGSLVHCIDGLKPIESLNIGQLVLTSTGYRPVTDLMVQGVQSVVRIKTNSSDVICTPNHRIAVLTSFNEYEWKLAEDLEPGDRIVFVDEVLHGSATKLPEYSDTRKYNTTASKISIPQLDEQIAWMLGYLSGDGYVQTTKNRKRGGSRYIGFSFNNDGYSTEIEQRLRTALSKFGVNVCNHKSNDNSKKLRITSSRLVDYFLRNFKTAKTSIDIPQCILLGTPSIRASYLAGVLDSDGSVKTKPNSACTTIYSDFRNQIISLYASLGIPTRYEEFKINKDNWNVKWAVNLVGEFALRKFEYLVQPHSIKKIKDRIHNSGYDFGYPNNMVIKSGINTKRKWCRNSKQMTVLCAQELGVDTHLIPITVESVEHDVDRVETYDITVDGQHEFVVNGILVHNSAEIAFGNPEDIEYISMKNPTKDLNSQEIQDYYNVTNKLYGASRYKAVVEDFNDTVFVKSEESKAKLPRVIEVFNAMNDRRWASNNSVLATVGMDYTNVGAMTAANGEPGYIWLDNMRDYGRMIDGRQPGIDGRVKGSNPCFAGNMRILTNNGYVKISELWEKQGNQDFIGSNNNDCLDKYGSQLIVNRNGVTIASNVYKTSDNEAIYRVQFNNGQYIDATENHQFIVLLGKNEHRCKLRDLLIGMKLPISKHEHFGAHDDKEFALLAGWCIGDGSLSKQKDDQITAHITCYQTDTIDVMSNLIDNMKVLYDKYNTSSQQNPSYDPWTREQDHFNHSQNNIRSNVLGRLLKENGVVPGDKHHVPSCIWSSNKQTVSAFLRGLFGADGSFQINKGRNCASIRLTSVYKNLLNECQLLLLQFGITSSVSLRRKKRKILMNDGKGGKKLYSTRETYELIINSNKNCALFNEHIGFIQEHKNAKLLKWVLSHSYSEPRQYVKVSGIQYIGHQSTYCLTEPAENEVCVSGVAVGNCVEQSLESYELCVSGDTRIQTKTGAIKIVDLVGKSVEVWNGKEWSKVTPKQTGSSRLLRRVTLSDGSYLDATPNHKWSVKNSAGKFVEIQTDQLMFGDELESFSLPNIDGVTAIPDILAKLAAGDSSVEKQVVDVYKQEIADQLLDSRKPLPECVMEMGSKNSAEFLASWARTNGSIVLRDSKVIINAPANRLHDLQLLARRARQNDVVVDLESKVLIINNICDKFCVMLGGKNNVEPSNNIQTVVSVDQIPGTHDTYCFNEQKRHKGVFNNVLTHQCNLVESFPHKHDNEEDYMRTIKYAYLYGKTVTLLPTHCDKTNTVMLRNRRIGLSQSGIVQAVEKFGRRRYLQNFCDAAYNEIRRWDRIYSEYFTCRESIKVTSIKPSGCRPWDALTTTDNGILTLEELFELSKHKNGDDWSEMDHQINVIQSKNITKECNGDVMVATKCVDRITKTYDNGISDTVIIKLSHNFELQSTPNHQWFVSARYDRTKKSRYVDVQEWKKASDLTENDILEVVPGIYNNNRHSELFELHDRAISMRGNIAEIKMPKYMNEDLAWLLGYMWGDGSQSYSKYRMRYSDENLFNLHKAQRIILDQFGLESSIKPASEGRNSYELSVGSKNLWHWLLINDILKIKSNADLIPKVIRSSSKSDILAFLAGLLDSDGCIGRRFNDQYCIISMAGGKFARHVQDIALSVGLVFSRSLNARGKNKQETKAMWSLSLMRSSLLPEFELFKKHCNKCVEKSDPSLPWTCELNNDIKILGKVKSVSDGPRVATFDIEVDDSHWYYAGAIKSHNTVSLIAGATPGIHFPEATSYWRRMRIAKNHSLVKILADAGYHIEPAVSDPENTVVVTFGVEDVGVKPINQVSIWEQMDNVAAIQHYWADNAVSVTIQFQPSEASDIPKILEHYEDRIKAVSFLPHFSHGYAQAPYEAAKKEDIVAYNKTLKPIDFSSLVDKETGEKYCDTDTCTL